MVKILCILKLLRTLFKKKISPTCFRLQRHNSGTVKYLEQTFASGLACCVLELCISSSVTLSSHFIFPQVTSLLRSYQLISAQLY